MKKTLLLLAMMVSVASFAWKPIFVGHRGGYHGVENSAEAFRNAADDFHFDGIECDVRVTSDNKYVISHDEKTERLGGNLVVESATLAQLKAETYTQTRGGTTYTGTICTMEEYLQICNDKNLFPLIELKWTTGINNNDMSKFAGLAALIEKYNLGDKVIFLTSMQKSIEFVRSNYPQYKCQYLVNTIDMSKIAFCRQWNVDCSCQNGGFSLSHVAILRKAGLNVGVWTINSESAYTTHGNMGAYMMTCDYLVPSEMPELNDIDWSTIVPIEEISLSPSDIHAHVGDTILITATLTPDSTTETITYTSTSGRAVSMKKVDNTHINLIGKSECEGIFTVSSACASATVAYSFTKPTAVENVAMGGIIDWSRPVYNMEGKRVDRDYHGVVVQDEKKAIR